jgi:hypothetical protein
MLMKTSLGAIWQQQRSYTEEEMKLFARSYFREIKLDTTNTLWSDLADRCFEEFKKKRNENNHTLPCSRGSVGK